MIFVIKIIVCSSVAEPSRWIVVSELCTAETHFIQLQSASEDVSTQCRLGIRFYHTL